jgi:predicted HAD superfamily hydrolase
VRLTLARPSLIAKLRAAHSYTFPPKLSSVKAVSFDVFDTLVQRPFENPKDVFFVVEQLAKERGLPVTKFSLIRPEAEQEARIGIQSGEVNLEDIYQKLKAIYSLTDEQTSDLRDIEIDVEIKLCTLKPEGLRLWNEAKALGVPIFLISDMYLPADVISKICTNSGYNGWSKLFLSSDLLASKRKGDLFGIVLRDLKLKPSELLHIGDNWRSDILRARQKSIKTRWLPNPTQEFARSSFYKNVGNRYHRFSPDLVRSSYVALVSQRLLSCRGKKPSMQDVGYKTLGPCVFSYASWLIKEAKEKDVSRLFFLSRDTLLFFKAYEMLTEDREEKIPAQYLLASRRAACVPALVTDQDVYDLACLYFDPKATVSQLLYYRFGLSRDILTPEVLNKAGFNSPDEPIGKRQFSRFVRLCQAVRSDISKQALFERAGYLHYLSGSGFTEERNPALVDIGWSGTIHQAMGRTLGKKMIGFYYATFERAGELIKDGHEIYSFSEHLRREPRQNKLAYFKMLSEFVFCGSESSLVSFGPGGTPVFLSNDLPRPVLHVLDELHKGALDFVIDMKKRLGPYLSFVEPDAAAAEYFFDELLELDLVLKKEAGASIENQFGGEFRLPLVKSQILSKWKLPK